MAAIGSPREMINSWQPVEHVAVAFAQRTKRSAVVAREAALRVHSQVFELPPHVVVTKGVGAIIRSLVKFEPGTLQCRPFRTVTPSLVLYRTVCVQSRTQPLVFVISQIRTFLQRGYWLALAFI